MSDPVVTLAAELIRIPSISGTAAEGDALTMLADRLGDRYRIETVHDERGMRALAALPPESERELLVVSGHVDVVPVGDASAWRLDPYCGVVRDERLHGRGASDMKAGIAGLVEALRDAPAGAPVAGLFSVEEETGARGAAAAGALLAGRPVGAVLVAEPTDGVPLRGHKGVTWVRASAAGVAAHGSAPRSGVNAIARLNEALADAQRAEGPWETVNVGTIRGGSAVNIVPDHAEADIDMRTTTSDADLAGWWREHPAVDAVQTLLDLPPVLLDPADPVLEQLGVEVHERVAGYFSDAAVLVGLLECRRVILWGPGDVDQAHRVDESASVPRIVRTAAAYQDLVERWCSR